MLIALLLQNIVRNIHSKFAGDSVRDLSLASHVRYYVRTTKSCRKTVKCLASVSRVSIEFRLKSYQKICRPFVRGILEYDCVGLTTMSSNKVWKKNSIAKLLTDPLPQRFSTGGTREGIRGFAKRKKA